MRRSGGFLLDHSLPQRRHGSQDRDGFVREPSHERAGLRKEGGYDGATGKRESSLAGSGKKRESGSGYEKSRHMADGRRSEQSNDIGRHSTGGGTSRDKDSITPGGTSRDQDGITTGGTSRDKDGITTGGSRNGYSGKGKTPSSNSSSNNRRSLESAMRPSPLSRGAWYTGLDTRMEEEGTRPPPPSLDPAQLVQMALSLSEGRRRHVSAGLTIPAQPSDTRRIRSSGAPSSSIQVGPGSPWANDALRPDSARSSQTPQSKSSRASGSHALSDHDDRLSNDVARLDANLNPRDSNDLGRMDANPFYEEDVEYQFSAATLNRAERAKRFFELASEYRRLLTHLPPLKPDATAPGNYTFHTQPAAAGAFPHITRVRSNTLSKHDLGRVYNPLQLLRNRRIRHREQRPLDPPPEVFDHVDKVRAYIDQVEDQSRHPAYRASSDLVTLPQFRRSSIIDDMPPAPSTRGHKRTDTSASKTTRPIGDWGLNPAELFADALWLEQNDNKTLIENRHGNKIFPTSDRLSLESTHSARKSKESLRPSLERTRTYDSTAATADETAGKRGRKKRKLLSLRNVDSAARRHIFRQRARSTSSSSTSSVDKRTRHYEHGDSLDNDNTGPLDRHMRTLIETEQNGSVNSPQLISPDKWDRSADQSKESAFIEHEENFTSPSKSNHVRNPSVNTDDPVSPGEDHFSFDDSTAPNSPYHPTNIPVFGMSLSPPSTRQPSPERRPRFFHSTTKQDHQIQETDFANSQTSLPKPKKSNTHDSTGKRSFESVRPNMLKRHKTTTSISSDRPSQYERRESKETSVSRFFKGGRIGDLVRSESSTFGDVIWKKKPPKNTSSVSDASDDEDHSPDERHGQPLKQRPGILSRENSKPKYHTPGLPTFKSQNAPPDHAENDQDTDPLTQRNDLRREQSDPARPGVPRIQLPDEDSSERPELTKASSVTVATATNGRNGSDVLLPISYQNRSRDSSVYNLAYPGSIPPGAPKRYPAGLSVTSNTHRPTLQSKRQWSISDAGMSNKERDTTQKVSLQDLARVRALFLASGVKAHELIKRAHCVVDPPSEFVLSAAKLAGQDVEPVSAREEFIVAAKLLSSTINTSSEKLRAEFDSSRSLRVPALHARFEELKHQIDERMMPQIQSTADEADAFTVQLTTHQTLAVKQVNDAVDNILRSRRRRLRVLRKAGFAVLEWFVLSLLWVVWFIVVIIRLFRAVVKGTVHGIRWCLWL